MCTPIARTRGEGKSRMRPAVWVAVALAAGIAGAERVRPHPAAALSVVLLCAAWAGLDPRRLLIGLLAAVAALGALRFAFDQTAGRGNIGAWQGQEVLLVATVVGEPELRKPAGLTYIARAETVNGHTATGLVHVAQSGGKGPGFGERVELRGALKAPSGARIPGRFDQAAYLARQGVYLTLETRAAALLGPGDLHAVQRAAVATRLRLEAVLKATLPPREAALAGGLLFGTRSDLPDSIKDAFKTSGVFHLLAVSGGNLAMVIMPLIWLLRRIGLSKRAASAVALPAVVFFVFLTGASPSVLRAGLMAALVLAGDLLRRERNALNTLGAATFLLLLATPRLLFDLGFQLSAGATLGILLFARSIAQWLAVRFTTVLGERAGRWAAEGLSVTFAAQALVEPLSLHSFGAWSTVAPVANLLVLAFLEPVVQVGAVAALLGLVWLQAARALMWAVRFGLWLLQFVVGATSSVPGAYLEVGRLPLWGVLAWYGMLAVAASPNLRRALKAGGLRAVGRWQGGSPQHRLAVAACVGLAVLTGVAWRQALAVVPDALEVAFLDVGQGDAIFLRAPNGETMLVDAGPYFPTDPKTGRPGYDAGAEVVLPFLAERGVKRLDYLVLTHPDLDHAGGGASVLRGVAVGTVLKSDLNPAERRYLEALTVAAEQGIPVRQPAAGEEIALGEVMTEVLNPPAQPYVGTRSDDNSNCIALRIRYRNVAIVLACDLEAVVEEDLAAHGAPLRADLLKVSHHGAGASSTAAFLQAIAPRFAVVSAGNGNRYGHPHAATLERLDSAGVRIYRTDRHGTVTAVTDGFALDVKGERGGPEDDGYRPVGLLGRRWLGAW